VSKNKWFLTSLSRTKPFHTWFIVEFIRIWILKRGMKLESTYLKILRAIFYVCITELTLLLMQYISYILSRLGDNIRCERLPSVWYILFTYDYNLTSILDTNYKFLCVFIGKIISRITWLIDILILNRAKNVHSITEV
jgi:hypothetical protein